MLQLRPTECDRWRMQSKLNNSFFYVIGVSNGNLYKFSITEKMVCFLTSSDNIFEDISGQKFQSHSYVNGLCFIA